MIYGNPTQQFEGRMEAPKSIDRMPAIASELEQQAKMLAVLNELAVELQNRLTPVLRPSAPTPAGAGSGDNILKGVPPLGVPLAQHIATHTEQMAEACNRLRAVIERIEL